MLQTFTVWTITVAATLPAPARLLLQVLCRTEETDRTATVIDANWPALWRRLDQPGEPPPLACGITALITAALIVTDPIDNPAERNEPAHYRIHSGVVEAINAMTPEPVTAAVDTQLAAWWTAVVCGWGIEQQQAGQDTSQFMLPNHSNGDGSPAPRRTISGSGPVKSITVVGSVPQSPESTTASTA